MLPDPSTGSLTFQSNVIFSLQPLLTYNEHKNKGMHQPVATPILQEAWAGEEAEHIEDSKARSNEHIYLIVNLIYL